MTNKNIIPFREGAAAAGAEGESPLFDEVKTLSDHDLAITIGAIRRPRLPSRAGHPITRHFPSVSDAEYVKLREDIRRNGQRRAICMYQGYIWDGRARHMVCCDLGLVPKLWILRVRDPILFLIHRHDRYGAPNSPERHAAVGLLNRVLTREWKDQAKKDRADWIDFARDEFREMGARALPCFACGLDRKYSHAHHLLPLSIQYDLGTDYAIHDHEWLCPVHHREVHRKFAAELTPTRGNADHGVERSAWMKEPERSQMKRTHEVFLRGFQIFTEAGGIAERGNWAMLRP